MRKDYSIKELMVLRMFIQMHGHLTYGKASSLEEEYYHLTGVYRSGGALYMAAWRLEKGHYNRFFTDI